MEIYTINSECSGAHVSNTSDLAVFQLLTITQQTIRNIVVPHFLTTQNITDKYIFNIRVKLKPFSPSRDDTYEDFKAKFGKNTLSNSIEEIDVTDDGDACQVVAQQWISLINEEDDDCLISFSTYMENTKDFSYKIFRNNSGSINGYIWMTVTMRSNFEISR